LIPTGGQYPADHPPNRCDGTPGRLSCAALPARPPICRSSLPPPPATPQGRDPAHPPAGSPGASTRVRRKAGICEVRPQTERSPGGNADLPRVGWALPLSPREAGDPHCERCLMRHETQIKSFYPARCASPGSGEYPSGGPAPTGGAGSPWPASLCARFGVTSCDPLSISCVGAGRPSAWRPAPLMADAQLSPSWRELPVSVLNADDPLRSPCRAGRLEPARNRLSEVRRNPATPAWSHSVGGSFRSYIPQEPGAGRPRSSGSVCPRPW
jgi:hypothetical protein